MTGCDWVLSCTGRGQSEHVCPTLVLTTTSFLHLFIRSVNAHLSAHCVPSTVLDTIEQNSQESLPLWSFILKMVLQFSPFHRLAD